MKKCMILGNSMGKEEENLDDQGCSNFRDLLDPKAEEEMRISSS